MKVLLSSKSEVSVIHLNGLMAIGGKSSSGHQLKSLSKKDDYAVISPSSEGISIVPLCGKNRSPKHSSPLTINQIEDLQIVLLPTTVEATNNEDKVSPDIEKAIEEITRAANDSDLTSIVLKHIVSLLGLDRGLVIAKNTNEGFEVVAHQGTDPSAPWLSESLLKETLTNKKSVVVPNILGSKFEKNQSLIGTGFLSVVSWPLIWRDEVVGAVIVGSPYPQQVKILENSTVSLLTPYVAHYVHSWVKEKKLERQLQTFRSSDNGPFLTQSTEFQNVVNLARKIAPSDLSVLIQGETGVGKEVMAKWLHEKSQYSSGAFVAVNCGAIPENLIESTLFGHKKGSFTGAIADHTGKFVLAHGGTIFLDEVADLPLTLQGKLLRVIQERSVEPVGSNRAVSINVRILCASHKDLKKLVEKGEFREDLYYRIAETTLEIPPLRDRKQDALLIGQNYLIEMNSKKKFSKDAAEWIQSQKWQGNVRELLSSIKRASVLSQGSEIEVRDFVETCVSSSERHWLGAPNLDDAIKNFQLEKVQLALKLSDGNRKNAAELLGVTPRTLFRYLEDFKGKV